MADVDEIMAVMHEAKNDKEHPDWFVSDDEEYVRDVYKRQPPYVCNGCSKRTNCMMDKKIYSSKYAQDSYCLLYTSQNFPCDFYSCNIMGNVVLILL